MRLLAGFRMLLLAWAILGYAANGAQAHVKLSGGESLSLMLCSTDSPRTIELSLPVEPAEKTTDTCCGDCTAPAAFLPPHMEAPSQALLFAPPVEHSLPVSISPRSPLWPGAPPQGPPSSHIGPV